MKLFFSLAGLMLAGGSGVWYWQTAGAAHVAFRFAEVKRGDVVVTINATGTLEPQEVVDVGVKVAGEIKGFGADPHAPGQSIDYGSQVEEGTVLAYLDDALFRTRVNQARANCKLAGAQVEQARAKCNQAQREFLRAQQMRTSGAVGRQEYDAAQANYETARAELAINESSLDVAKANLAEAEINLSYTVIRSPIKGVVIDRRANVGQAVVSSFNIPSLFLVATDLRRLVIWVPVNENDVGNIHPDQEVTFTVSTLPGEVFRGRVTQVRQNAAMNQNVVTYTVVVEVDNSYGKFMPYLTARTQFQVHERKDVLVLPNSALRWRPDPACIHPQCRAQAAALLAEKDTGGNQPGTAAQGQSRPAIVWVADGAFVRPLRCTAGLTDGIVTEVSGELLYAGMVVVTGQTAAEEDAPLDTPFLARPAEKKTK
jgi:HlyD family secretion protein